MSLKALYPFLFASAAMHLMAVAVVDHRLHGPSSAKETLQGVVSQALPSEDRRDAAEVFLEKEAAEPAAEGRSVAKTAARPALPAAKRAASPGRSRSGPARPQRRIRDSAELLADPQVGRVFSSYFSAIKKKIHDAALEAYKSSEAVEGRASLFFVLRSDGAIDRVGLSEQGTDTGAGGRRFALWCVERAAPFPAFPKELGLEKISFSVSMIFDDFRKN